MPLNRFAGAAPNGDDGGERLQSWATHRSGHYHGSGAAHPRPPTANPTDPS